jgi:hypothetical protein
MRMSSRFAFIFLAASSLPLLASASTAPAYRKLQLSDQFYCEGAAFGDLNKDGVTDAVSGPYWYEGPDFQKRHDLYPAGAFDGAHGYSDNFFTFTHDFNGDGWTDVLVLGFPGVDASWFENPAGRPQPWRRHVVFLPVDNESPTFADVFGTKQPVLLCMANGKIGYASYDAKDPVRPWSFHAISPAGPYQRFTHGLGYGDINGDGRADILEKGGWWEQPASLAGDPVWKHHPFNFGPDATKPARGGAHMHVMDVNGDGKGDVITSIDAHGYGVSWFEQVRSADGEISFQEHAITSTKPEEKLHGVQFAQPHAVAIADVDGDGLPDVITGKRWWAHGPTGDADPNGTPVIYAFLLRRGANGGATFEPRLIDDASGIGTQLTVGDANRDGIPDIVIGNKRGTFVFLSGPAGGTK